MHDTLQATVNQIVAQNPRIITTREVYAVFCQLWTSPATRPKLAKVTREIRPALEGQGWCYMRDAVLAGQTRINCFRRPKLAHGELRHYQECVSQYCVVDTATKEQYNDYIINTQRRV